MAIVKATYTRAPGAAKASIRYIQNRPGRAGEKASRTLFSLDGLLGRWQAYGQIDEAQAGAYFYRLVISPDPAREDTGKDLHLRELTEKTMLMLAERFTVPIAWVAAEHTEHAPHRHIHIVAVLPERLNGQDCKALIGAATEASREQRRELELMRLHQVTQKVAERGAQWERAH
jgi:hypothetical protein